MEIRSYLVEEDVNQSSPSSSKARRSKTAKSRSGCRQCKLRRIKCDEAQPGCHNCARKGFSCPGYNRDLRWSSKHEQFCEVQSASTGSTGSPSRDSSPITHDKASSSQDLVFTNYRTATPVLDSTFFNAPIDLSSTLVKYWFDSVCPLWSSFDSDISYNRKIPLDTWTTSEPVFFTLQAMSAAYLAESMPQVSAMLPSLIGHASSAIERKMADLRNSPLVPTANITVDLLFAIFAMGSSIHWANASNSDDTLFRYASEILGLWQMDLSAVDVMVHTYFHQALSHWRMLAAVGDQGDRNLVDREWLRLQGRPRQLRQVADSSAHSNIPQLSDGPPSPEGAGLHSWCGVSSEVIDIFGRIVALCRSSRLQYRNPDILSTASILDEPTDIGLAWDLQQRLLGMDFDLKIATDELAGISMRTGDEKTPLSHLILTAEAYRLASLLQLHITFDSLVIKQVLKGHDCVKAATSKFLFAESASHRQKLVAMALQIAAILEQIPADSGSRCNQPVLLILAAAGLRTNTNAFQPALPSIPDLGDEGSCGPMISQLHRIPPNDAPSALLSPTYGHPITNMTITQASFEVSKARRFVKSRLRILHETLPPKPIDVALDLVDAIWTAYDSARPGADDIEWMDVMESTGLKTVFS